MRQNTRSFNKQLMLLFCIGLISACGQDEAESGSETDIQIVNKTDANASVSIASAEKSDLSPHQQMAKDLLKELIEIDTTHSSGDATRAAQAMADRLIAAGFPARDVQVLAPAPGKGNLIARYRGRDTGQRPLLLLAHIVKTNA